MVSRREAREQRRQERQIKVDAQKLRLLERTVGQPKVAAPISTTNPQPKTGPLAHDPEQTPKESASRSIFSQVMTWADNKADREGHWTWGEPRQWLDEEHAGTIKPEMDQLARLTWGEIFSQTADKRKKHHHQALSAISPEARDRWIELGLDQFDEPFRFRIGGQMSRAWGYKVQAKFFLVWFERYHKIAPTAED